MAQLNLDPKRRANRQWQRDFFLKAGLNLEDKLNRVSYSNSLDYQAIQRIQPQPLNSLILSECIDEKYVNHINNNIKLSFPNRIRSSLFRMRGIGRVLKSFRFQDPIRNSYSAYMTLKPIDATM